MPVIRALEATAGEHGRWVHHGATTQDVLDTALILQLRDAHGLLRADLVALVGLLADLAARHRDTVMVGGTHAQPALPITFGFKVAGWLAETMRHVERLDQSAPRLLVGQLGGAVGTLAGFGPRGAELQRRVVARLGLGGPPIAWHAAREAVTEFLAGLAMVGSTLARLANEVIELSRAEMPSSRSRSPLARWARRPCLTSATRPTPSGSWRSAACCGRWLVPRWRRWSPPASGT